MKQFFLQDKILTGIIVGIGTLIICSALLTLGLVLTGEPVGEH